MKKILQCQGNLIVAQKSVEPESRLAKLPCQLFDKRDAEISAVDLTAVNEMETFVCCSCTGLP